jgi:hypothetical protein
MRRRLSEILTGVIIVRAMILPLAIVAISTFQASWEKRFGP